MPPSAAPSPVLHAVPLPVLSTQPLVWAPVPHRPASPARFPPVAFASGALDPWPLDPVPLGRGLLAPGSLQALPRSAGPYRPAPAPAGGGADTATTVTDCPLARLLEEARSGMESSFAELHGRTRSRLHGLVLRLVRSPELAYEVTQEAYLEIWQQADRYEAGRGSVLAWMMVIARRRAIDRVRSVTRTVALERRAAAASQQSEQDHADQVAERVDASRVHGLLNALTPLQREAVTLVYLERRTAQEAAVLLRVPLSTMKTRLRDGLQQLRRRHRDGQAAEAAWLATASGSA